MFHLTVCVCDDPHFNINLWRKVCSSFGITEGLSDLVRRPPVLSHSLIARKCQSAFKTVPVECK